MSDDIRKGCDGNCDDCDEVEVYTLTDENGDVSEFYLIGTLEYDKNKYVALIPTSEDTDEYVILKSVITDGEEMFFTIDDDDEFDAVADKFEEEFMSEYDCDKNGFSVEDENEEYESEEKD